MIFENLGYCIVCISCTRQLPLGKDREREESFASTWELVGRRHPHRIIIIIIIIIYRHDS
jgi:hypothetical protein